MVIKRVLQYGDKDSGVTTTHHYDDEAKQLITEVETSSEAMEYAEKVAKQMRDEENNTHRFSGKHLAGDCVMVVPESFLYYFPAFAKGDPEATKWLMGKFPKLKTTNAKL